MGAPITSRSNARVKALRASFSGKAARPGDLVGLGGVHLVKEALASGLSLDTVFVRAGSEELLQRPSLAGLPEGNVCVLAPDVFQSAVDTAAPQGIAAMLAIPPVRFLPMQANPGLFLFLEDVQDPGNVGTLVRSAEAFGVRQVVATPGCANAWGPKAMRASAGSVFRVPVQVTPAGEWFEAMRTSGIKMCAAVARGERALALDKADLSAPCALMIGNEGAGLSAAALAAAAEQVHIPCATESLNAAIAGSILMYEAARQTARLFERGAV